MIKLKGKVFSGIGEGEFYMSQEGYIKQFEKLFGFTPFPGTLNVRADMNEIKQFIKTGKSILIEGFSANGRSFGKLIGFRVHINNVSCVLIIPERTQHNSDVIELVSEVKLRKALNLNDGDVVTIEHE